jgi:hypothetical protein
LCIAIPKISHDLAANRNPLMAGNACRVYQAPGETPDIANKTLLILRLAHTLSQPRVVVQEERIVFNVLR